MKPLIGALAAAMLLLGASPSFATNLVPDFATAPAGWTVDRYAPDSFGNVGSFAGRDDVLGIGISPDDDLANRPAGQQSSFYNTQGMGHAISGGAGDSLEAGLYIPRDWINPANGARRTDMWGVLGDAGGGSLEYPIIGFTNSGDNGFVGFRVWTSGLGAWFNLVTADVILDGWNALSIAFDGDDFLFEVNGSLVATLAAQPGTVGFTSVLMQAYNFADPALFPSAVANAYTANWSNTQVPEPTSMLLLGTGLLGLGLVRQRARRRLGRA